VNFSILGVFLGNKCNLECDHCIPRSSISERGKLSSEEIAKIIEAVEKYKIPMISFTGGEPLLFYRNEIDKIISSLKGELPKIRITTNGTFLKQSNWKDYIPRNVTEIRLSYDTFHMSNLHTSDLMKLLEFCRLSGLGFYIEYILTNPTEMKVITEFPVELRNHIKFDLALRCGRAKDKNKYYNPKHFSIERLRGKCPSIAEGYLLYYQGRGFAICCNNLSETEFVPKESKYFETTSELLQSELYQFLSGISEFSDLALKFDRLEGADSMKCNFCETLLKRRLNNSNEKINA